MNSQEKLNRKRNDDTIENLSREVEILKKKLEDERANSNDATCNKNEIYSF